MHGSTESAPCGNRAEGLSTAESDCSSSAAGIWLPRSPSTGRRVPPWRWLNVAQWPESRSQWRDRTGFSPVSLSAHPVFRASLTAEAPSLLRKLYHRLALHTIVGGRPTTIIAAAAYSRFFRADGRGARLLGVARLRGACLCLHDLAGLRPRGSEAGAARSDPAVWHMIPARVSDGDGPRGRLVNTQLERGPSPSRAQ